jgi:hypothetical protein
MARSDETSRRLMTIPGLGPVTASAMAANVQNISAFSGPREFAAFLGPTPRQNSSGGKERLGRVSKMGNRYLRTLLVVGAHAVLYHRKPHDDALRCWAKKLMQTKPFTLVAVALANKMARIAFAIMCGKTNYSVVRANDRPHRYKGCNRIEGDKEVMRRERTDLIARGIVCAVERDNVIGAKDPRTTSGPTGVTTASTGRRHDRTHDHRAIAK